MTHSPVLPRWLFALAGFGVLLVISGCATLSHEECLRGDWYQVGVQDGQQGHAFSRIDDHRRACRDTPAIIDESAYGAGRDMGLLSYCTPVSGYRVGQQGNAAPNVCPVETAQGFLHGHLLGEQVYDTEQEVAASERRLRDLERRLQAKQEEIDEIRASIAALDERYDISGPRRTLRRLRGEADDLRDDIRDTQYEVDRARRTLDEVRERTSFQLQILASG